MKQWIRAALALVLLCCVGLCAVAEEAYPTQWDLTTLYESPEAWQADYDKVMAMLPTYEAFRGTLNSAQGLYDYYTWVYNGELTALQGKLVLYAQLGYSLNPADAQFGEMYVKLDQMVAMESAYSAFVDAEIDAIPLEQRQAMLADPLLKPWAYALRNLVDPEKVSLSEETNRVLAQIQPALGRAVSIFDILDSVELAYPIITMPDGSQAKLNEKLYQEITHSDAYDREFKSQCNAAYLSRQAPLINTFAALLESAITTNWSMAQVNGYATSREAAMDVNDVEPEIYDKVVASAHKGVADYQRYLDAHRRGLGLEKQYPFDLNDYVSDYGDKKVPYEDAVVRVREALGVLGEDYLAKYDQLIANGCLDVYPTDTKVTGAFSTISPQAQMPYMLFNYVGYNTDVRAIAHEMGHAIYSMYSAQAQDGMYYAPLIFTQEVASTTNELLYYRYQMEHAASEDERLFYLENLLQSFSTAFFTQVLYAEFEDAAYQTVEAGGSLNAEALGDLWVQLYDTYRGDTVTLYPESRYRWASIPHFYNNYYVYQYATSITYAASICQRITAGEPGAVEDYLQFLSLGSSAKPSELLRVAGVDPLEDATYDAALTFYAELVDEYERLVERKLAGEI